MKMVQKLVAILCALVICGSQTDSVLASEEVSSSCGFGYEILVARLEYLEEKLVEQQSDMKKLMNQLDLNQNRLEKILEDNRKSVGETIEAVVNTKLNQLSEKFGQLENDNKNRFEKTQVEIKKQNEQCKVLSSSFSMVSDDLKLIKSKVFPFRSCSDEPTKKSGQYWLQPTPGQQPFEGYCEQQKFKGGWLVFQRRFDGSVDFYRNWSDYKLGFGSTDGEFWLGLDTLHQLTKTRKYKLAVELEGFDGRYEYAMYDHFQIGSETENYKLKQLGKHSGTGGDYLIYHKGMSFTTKDKDNDLNAKGNCAVDNKGAWWYKDCASSNLNGQYGNEYSAESHFWWSLHWLQMTKMMVKEA